MREAAFLKKNKEKWRRFEQLLERPKNADPDEIASLFIEITDDLAYARTRYPRSATPKYLNQLAAKVHLAIYRNKKEGWAEIKKFWLYDVPRNVRMLFGPLFWASVVFLMAVSIGALSADRDEGFVRLILGDDYVETTLENIRNGNPTGIYQHHDSLEMFVFIAFNNLRVAFLMFAAGFSAGLLTFYMLLNNGVMVGAFFSLFSQYGASAKAWPVIMIHGTMELFSICIAGGAGFALAQGVTMPGTYKRLEMLKMQAQRGLTVAMAAVPFILIAAVLESFVTRHADLPLVVKYAIVAFSAAACVGYFVVYPIWLARRERAR
jgi:uncharacterized membrane protein SpoIIM required for sporulation